MKDELCALKVIRETWRLLKQAETIEEARSRFKELVLKLILE